MITELVPGQNCPVPDELLTIKIRAQAAADFSCFRLYANGKTRRDEDFVFYGQLHNEDSSIGLAAAGQEAKFKVNLPRLGGEVEKIAFAVTSEFPSTASLKSLELEIEAAGSAIVRLKSDLAGRDEAALIIGELYRRSGQWKFRFVDQGFRGGLKPLAEMYGVDVADDAPPPKKEEPPAKPVNLSKVVLTKAKPTVDLSKSQISRGVFRINLNWNTNPGQDQRGFLGRLMGKSSGIDLDLAAYVRLKNGDQTIIQALGENFGELDYPPYVQLQGDDRTGAQADGEWIFINGNHINEIDEIVIFTFIYEGVPNWRATDAVVRIEIPGLPEVETRMNEGNSDLGLCAIARIENRGGDLRIQRLEEFFPGHEKMDRAYGWGFRWRAGSK